jgi:hypothetical protein
MEKFDHEYTNNIVCPYCGYEDIDSWEVESGQEDLGLIECGNCEKEFYATRIISVEYSTEKAKYGTCKKCGKEDVVVDGSYSSICKYEDFCVRCGDNEKTRSYREYAKKMLY